MRYGLDCRILLLLFTLALFVPPGPTADVAFAQTDSEFKNLKVLPRDIENPELMDLMKSFTVALGVRCEHCHMGEAGAPLSEFDFPSDENKQKETARTMMKLTQEINDKYFPNDTAYLVRCVTCHHGQTHPRTLEDVLAQILEQQGSEAAVAKYRELREQYYGGYVFDFRETVLTRFARDLVSMKLPAEALRMLELNAEFYPDSAMTYFTLGEIYMMMGDRESAIRSYERTIELDPKIEMAHKKLKILKRQQR